MADGFDIPLQYRSHPLVSVGLGYALQVPWRPPRPHWRSLSPPLKDASPVLTAALMPSPSGLYHVVTVTRDCDGQPGPTSLFVGLVWDHYHILAQ